MPLEIRSSLQAGPLPAGCSCSSLRRGDLGSWLDLGSGLGALLGALLLGEAAADGSSFRRGDLGSCSGPLSLGGCVGPLSLGCSLGTLPLGSCLLGPLLLGSAASPPSQLPPPEGPASVEGRPASAATQPVFTPPVSE